MLTLNEGEKNTWQHHRLYFFQMEVSADVA